VLLRLEDHDRARCRPLYETALLEDLEWLGLEPDVGGPTELRAGPSGFRQSDCAEVYERTLTRLASRRPVYACGCSRRSLAPEADMPDGVEVPYSGRCRNRGLPLGPGRGVRVPLGAGTERFEEGAPWLAGAGTGGAMRRPPDPASGFPASPAALPGGGPETQQSESRHGAARAAGGRRRGGGPRRSRIPGEPPPPQGAGLGGDAGPLVRVGAGHLLRWSKRPTASSVCLTNPLAARNLVGRPLPPGPRRHILAFAPCHIRLRQPQALPGRGSTSRM